MRILFLSLIAVFLGCEDQSISQRSTPAPENQSEISDTSVKDDFAVTPAAITVLKNAADAENTKYVRASITGGGCSGFIYALEVTNDYDASKDQRLKLDGISLLIDNRSYSYMKGTTLDYVTTAGSAGFKFDNPNNAPTEDEE